MTLLVLFLLFAPTEETAITAGKKAFDAHRYEEAIRIWKGVEPGNCQAPFYIGLAHYRLHHRSEAKVHFREASECSPGEILPKIALAEATAETGDPKRAFALYEDALKVDANSIDALRGASAIAITNQWNDKAIIFLVRLAKLLPADGDVRAQLGAAYAATSQMQLAEEQFETALRLQPGNPSAQTGLASVYIKLNRVDEAEKILSTLVTSGQSFEPFFLLGSTYNKQARYEDAVLQFRKALAIDSKQPEVYYHLATALGRLNRREERDQALAQFRALKLQGETSATSARDAAKLVQDAKPLVDRGEIGQALKLLEQAYSLQPENAEILFRMAGLRYDLRQYEAARENVRAAISNTPDAWMYHLLLGLIERDTGNLDAARSAIDTAVKLNPLAADGHNHAGVLAMRQFRMQDAVDSFQKAVDLAPEDAAFQANLQAAKAASARAR